MRKGKTRLVDECRYLVRRPSEVFLDEGQDLPSDDSDAEPALLQEEFSKHPVHVPYRSKKDPRDLKILDPACGSGHFLLYAFDLLLSIYDEAWHDAASPESEVTGRSLRDDYPEVKQLHKALPGLVLTYNLHGIDIDPRTTQIAAMALWMRGQRFFDDVQIARVKRRPIARSNIVCAEPMPGEEAFLDEFIAEHLSKDAEDRFLGSLVRKVFDAMKLAGDAGSLLRIEEEIADEVAKAKKQWLKRSGFKQQTLFADGPTKIQRELDLTHGIADESFWEEAEQRIYVALREYSEQAERSGGYQRRLFATDAARGFAFIDLCRQKHDVVLMNPPFGNPCVPSKDHLRLRYPTFWANLYSAFIYRGIKILTEGGKLGAITSRSYLALSSFEDLRTFLLDETDIKLLAECGLGVLDDASVRVAFLVASGPKSPSINSLFINLRQSERPEKELLLHTQFKDIPGRYWLNTAELRAIPSAPFAYWLPPKLVRFLANGPFLDSCRVNNDSSHIAHVAVGATTADDFRFVRCHWEVPSKLLNRNGWAFFVHANGFYRYHCPTYAAVKWFSSGHEIMSVRNLDGTVKARLRCADHFFSEGLVSPNISERGLGCGYLMGEQIISNTNRGYFGSEVSPPLMLALLNSSIIDLLIWALTPDRHHEAGTIASLPVPSEIRSIENMIADKVEEIWSIIFSLRQLDEVDALHLFSLYHFEKAKELEWHAFNLQKEVDSHIATLFGIGDTQIEKLYEISGAKHDFGQLMPFDDVAKSPVNEFENCNKTLAAFISHCVGVVFGRWNILITCGQVESHVQKDGRLLAPGPHVLSETCNDYPAYLIRDTVVADDEGTSGDIVTAVSEVCLYIICKTPKNSLGASLARTTEQNKTSCRKWIARKFFSDHIRRYFQCRRKAPIYWQLATPSASYSVWLYYHRFTKDTIFKVVNEYVRPKLQHERQKLDRQTAEAGTQPTSTERRELEDQEKIVAELASMVEELGRIAPLWNPNLNDGVIINFAPLWRLVPQHKAWQKECRKVWDKLVQGEYDWAHLAMHLWPERVVPKCHEDRSLAIAHDMEALLWVEDAGKWRPIEDPDSEIHEQRNRRSREGFATFQKAMASLAKDKGDTVSAVQAWKHLSEGDWDDTPVAMLLWPRRVVTKCFDSEDDSLAKKHNITEWTKNGGKPVEPNNIFVERLVDYHEKFSCPRLLEPLERSMSEAEGSLAEYWAYLSRTTRDYSELSLLLWPDRIVYQCTEDVDVAEAKGMQDFFWLQETDGQWRRRLSPEEEIQQEVARRHSPAVKAALQSLLEAPTPTSGSGRSRRRRGAGT
jgi:hypothetical protein